MGLSQIITERAPTRNESRVNKDPTFVEFGIARLTVFYNALNILNNSVANLTPENIDGKEGEVFNADVAHVMGLLAAELKLLEEARQQPPTNGAKTSDSTTYETGALLAE